MAKKTKKTKTEIENNMAKKKSDKPTWNVVYNEPLNLGYGNNWALLKADVVLNFGFSYDEASALGKALLAAAKGK